MAQDLRKDKLTRSFMTLNLNSKIVMTQIALTSPDLNKANLRIKQELNLPVEAKLEIT